jgi:ubiquitin-protein ligase
VPVSDVRDRRLSADYAKVRMLTERSGGRLVIESTRGHPPHVYALIYHCRGIEALRGDQPSYRREHRVQFLLPAAYPGDRPAVKVLTAVVHPHVFEYSNDVCIGAWRISEHLDQLVLRIGAILQWDPQYFDFRSPANHAAATWARSHMHLFPLDTMTFTRSARPPDPIEWRDLS